MKRNKVALASGLLLASSLAMAGCGSSPSPTTTGAVGTPQSGGTLVMALPPATNINWYFPLMNGLDDSLYNAWVQSMMYKPLITLNGNGSINYSRSIASKITPNAAGTSFTVTMNPKYKWSNGHPVTAQDVLFTWKIIQGASASNAPAPWPYVGAGTGDIPTGVQSVVANGQHSFTVTLKKPANQEWFIYNGLGDFIPLPKSVFDHYQGQLGTAAGMKNELTWLGKIATQPTNPAYQVVDGPFKLVSATPSQNWIFKPNPTYGGHKAYLSKLIFQFETTSQAEFAALKTGTVQAGYLPSSLYKQRNSVKGYKFSVSYALGYDDTIVNMNTGNSKSSLNAPNGVGTIFNHLYVRQALQYGINQPAINTAAYQGNGIVENGIVLPKPRTIFYNPKLKMYYPYNPSKGKALLKAHGWSEVNGVMQKNGQKMSFTLDYSSGSKSTVQEVTLMQEGWAKEGIQVKLVPEPFSTIVGLTNNQWQMEDYGGISWGGSYPTGGGLFGTPGVGLDSQGYSSKTMTKLINATHQPYATQAQSLKALYNFQTYVSKDLPILFVPYGAGYALNADNVHNVMKYSNPFTQGISPQYWWMSK